MRALFVFLLFCAVPAFAEEADPHLPLNAMNRDAVTVGDLTFKGALVLPSGKDKVGGLSALSVSPDLKSWVALSDISRVFRGTLEWNEDGTLKEAALKKDKFLRDENAKPVNGRARSDAESMAPAPNGGWWVGFEREHRVMLYKDDAGAPGGTPVALPVPPGLLDLSRNSGLETLAALKGGRLLAIAEAAQDGEGNYSAWLFNGQRWETLTYVTAPEYQPTDATVLPNGDLLVLERRFNFFTGFATRIKLVPEGQVRAGTTLKGQLVAELAPPYISENFEGIDFVSVTPESGLVFILSDNNLNAIQQTILAVFQLNLKKSH